MNNTLTVTYTGTPDDQLEATIRAAVEKHGWKHLYSCFKALTDEWIMRFKK